MALISDMIIEIYGMESGLLRTLKSIERGDTETSRLQSAVVKTYVNDVFKRVEWFTVQALSAMSDEKGLKARLLAVDKAARFVPVNTIAMRREIANAVIKIGRYPF